MKRYVQIFKVTGRGYFPLDMLRYDRCFPGHETDSPKLGGDYNGELRTVEMQRYIVNPRDYPTSARWESFGWAVDSDSVHSEKLA